jgi:hypothetical protein
MTRIGLMRLHGGLRVETLRLQAGLRNGSGFRSAVATGVHGHTRGICFLDMPTMKV